MFTTSLDCSKVILGSYLDCLSLCNALCDVCTMMSYPVMYFSECVPIGQTAHDCIFSPEGKCHWTVNKLQNHWLHRALWGGQSAVLSLDHTVHSCLGAFHFYQWKEEGDTDWGEDVHVAQGCRKNLATETYHLTVLKGRNIKANCEQGRPSSEDTRSCL